VADLLARGSLSSATFPGASLPVAIQAEYSPLTVAGAATALRTSSSSPRTVFPFDPLREPPQILLALRSEPSSNFCSGQNLFNCAKCAHGRPLRPAVSNVCCWHFAKPVPSPRLWSHHGTSGPPLLILCEARAAHFPEGLSQNLRRRSQEQTCHYRGDQQVRPFRRRAPDCQSSDHNRDIPNGIIP
jgi:hypothetical protein